MMKITRKASDTYTIAAGENELEFTLEELKELQVTVNKFLYQLAHNSDEAENVKD